jgi:hypothetical protein
VAVCTGHVRRSAGRDRSRGRRPAYNVDKVLTCLGCRTTSASLCAFASAFWASLGSPTATLRRYAPTWSRARRPARRLGHGCQLPGSPFGLALASSPRKQAGIAARRRLASCLLYLPAVAARARDGSVAPLVAWLFRVGWSGCDPRPPFRVRRVAVLRRARSLGEGDFRRANGGQA